MIQQKSIVTCIILSIVTCGIYSIVWFIQMNDDINNLSGDFKTSGGVAFLLMLVTCNIYGLYWMYNQGQRLDALKQARGIPSSNSGVLYLILSLLGLGIVSYALIQNEINNLA